MAIVNLQTSSEEYCMLGGALYVVPHKTYDDFKIGISEIDRVCNRLSTISRKCGGLNYERGVMLLTPSYRYLEKMLLDATYFGSSKRSYPVSPTEWRRMEYFARVVKALEGHLELYCGTPGDESVRLLRNISFLRKQHKNNKYGDIREPTHIVVPAKTSLFMKPAFCTPLVSESIGVLGRKIINVLIFYASTQEPDKREYRIPIKILTEIINYRSNNLAYLLKYLEYLQRVEILPVAYNKHRFQFNQPLRIFDTVVVGSGQITYHFSRQMNMLLLETSTKVPLDMSQFVSLKSRSAQAIYELCQRFESKEYMPWLPLIDIKRMTDHLKIHKFDEFGYYNEIALKKGCKEIQEATGSLIEIDYHREGRRVTHVRLMKAV